MNRWGQYQSVRDHLRRMNPDWSWGQCCFEALRGVDPQLAEKIRNGLHDPRFVGVRVADFEKAIRNHWERAA